MGVTRVVCLLSVFGTLALASPNISKLLIDIRPHFRFNCVHVMMSGLHEGKMAVALFKNLTAFKILAVSLTLDNIDSNQEGCSLPLKILLPPVVNRDNLLQMSQRLAMARSQWLLFLQDWTQGDEVLLNVNIPFDCQLLVATPHGDHLTLTEVYRVAPDRALQKDLFGLWSEATGFLSQSPPVLYDRRNNLQGLHFKVTTIHNPPLYIVSKQNGRLVIEGFFGLVWDALQENLNITSTCILPAEGKWGIPTDRGWDGMVGLILRGEANVTCSGITMLSSRAAVVDFTYPLFTSSFRVFLRRPSTRESVKSADFLTPFSHSMWLALMITTLAAAALLAFQHHVTRGFTSDNKDCYSLSDAILLVFGVIFCQQGPAFDSSHLSSRLIRVALYIAAVVTINSYSGRLISSLTVYQPRLPFYTLAQLNSSSSAYTLGIINNSISMAIFKGAKEGLLKDLHDKFLASSDKNLLSTTMEGYIRVCKENFAFIVTKEAMTLTAMCDVTSLPDAFAKSDLALALTRGSPYRGLINHTLLKLMESGVLHYLHDSSWSQRTEPSPPSLKRIELLDVQPLLGLLCGGVMLSGLILAMEVLKVNHERRRRVEILGPRRLRRVNLQQLRTVIPTDRKLQF